MKPLQTVQEVKEAIKELKTHLIQLVFTEMLEGSDAQRIMPAITTLHLLEFRIQGKEYEEIFSGDYSLSIQQREEIKKALDAMLEK